MTLNDGGADVSLPRWGTYAGPTSSAGRWPRGSATSVPPEPIERTLREVVQTRTVQKKFLVDRVADDPTAVYAGIFLPLAKQVDAALAVPSFDAAQSLMGTIDGAIEKAGLRNSYTVSRDDAAKRSGLDALQTKSTANTIQP